MNASPLSATLTVIAMSSTIAPACDAANPHAPSASITTTAERATQRSGLSRLPTRSLSTPTPTRPSAPMNCPTPTSTPAARVDQCNSVTSQTSPKMESVNCGTTRRIDTRWMRHRNPLVRYGFGVGATSAALGARGGFLTTSAHSTASAAVSTSERMNVADTPLSCAIVGTVRAARVTPSGWHIWRIPIASPRRSFGNQPTTTLPLAALVLADAAPPSSRKTPSSM